MTEKNAEDNESYQTRKTDFWYIKPNGQATQFVKGVSCLHDWRVCEEDDGSERLVEMEGEKCTEEVCDDCGAYCLRALLGGELLAYDNSEGLDLDEGR